MVRLFARLSGLWFQGMLYIYLIFILYDLQTLSKRNYNGVYVWNLHGAFAWSECLSSNLNFLKMQCNLNR